MTLPRWKCHKKVQAIKIAVIEFAEDGSAKIMATQEFTPTGVTTTVPGYRFRFKGTEEDLGYFVVYDDGYQSWSPTRAFEEGYARI